MRHVVVGGNKVIFFPRTGLFDAATLNTCAVWRYFEIALMPCDASGAKWLASLPKIFWGMLKDTNMPQ